MEESQCNMRVLDYYKPSLTPHLEVIPKTVEIFQGLRWIHGVVAVRQNDNTHHWKKIKANNVKPEWGAWLARMCANGRMDGWNYTLSWIILPKYMYLNCTCIEGALKCAEFPQGSRLWHSMKLNISSAPRCWTKFTIRGFRNPGKREHNGCNTNLKR